MTVIEEVALVTVAEYEVVEEVNVGERVPEEMVIPDKVASFEVTKAVPDMVFNPLT